MSRSVALVILIVGGVLLVAGIRSSRTASSQLSEMFNNRPTQETSILLAVGTGAIAVGAWGLFKPQGK